MKKINIGFVLTCTVILCMSLACILSPLVLFLRPAAESDPFSLWWALPLLAGLGLVLLFGNSRRAKPEPQTHYLSLNLRDAGEQILHYAAMAEARQYGRQIGADIMLVLPANFSREKLEYDAALNYDYLVENGPSQGVYTEVAK